MSSRREAAAGFVTGAQATAIEASGEAIIPLIESARPPFDGSMIDWRPDPSWPIPAHPDGWAEVPPA